MTDNKTTFPKRKNLRLTGFDYDSTGAYFVTVCTKDRERILSNITESVGGGAHDVPKIRAKMTNPACDGAHDIPKVRAKMTNPVGDGAHDVPEVRTKMINPVGDGAHDVPRKPEIKLTPIGAIVEKHLLSSERISGVKIDRYAIMPDHIHAIIILDSDKYDKHKDGTSKAPSPTNKMLPHVISTFKRFCVKEIGYNIFERGYYDHIIRDKDDYETRVRYIHENPMKWIFINQITDETSFSE